MKKKNETKEYKFIVRDTHGYPFITIEPMQGDISVFKNATLTFNLREGVTNDQAKEVAKKLNDVIQSLNYQEIEN